MSGRELSSGELSSSGSAGVGSSTLVPSEQDEWLEADGLGGFASGTTIGLNTRRYHALLLVAVEPPAARHVLVNDAVVWLKRGSACQPLSSHRFSSGAAAEVTRLAQPPRSAFRLRRGLASSVIWME